MAGPRKKPLTFQSRGCCWGNWGTLAREEFVLIFLFLIIEVISINLLLPQRIFISCPFIISLPSPVLNAFIDFTSFTLSGYILCMKFKHGRGSLSLACNLSSLWPLSLVQLAPNCWSAYWPDCRLTTPLPAIGLQLSYPLPAWWPPTGLPFQPDGTPVPSLAGLMVSNHLCLNSHHCGFVQTKV